MCSSKEIFEGFQGAYMHSSDFPEQAKEQIPKSLFTAIDYGNKSFFQEFQASLPKLYKALIEQCGRVHLLESIVMMTGLINFGEEARYYRWGLKCKKKIIASNIPVKDRSFWLEEYLLCLPAELHCFYQKMDGMVIANNLAAYDYDLPASFANWRGLRNYCLDKKIPLKNLKSLLNDFQNDNLRVLIRGSLGDLIFLNFDRKDKKLYHVKNHDFSNYKLIEKAPQILDTYFTNVILGFAEPILLN